MAIRAVMVVATVVVRARVAVSPMAGTAMAAANPMEGEAATVVAIEADVMIATTVHLAKQAGMASRGTRSFTARTTDAGALHGVFQCIISR